MVADLYHRALVLACGHEVPCPRGGAFSIGSAIRCPSCPPASDGRQEIKDVIDVKGVLVDPSRYTGMDLPALMAHLVAQDVGVAQACCVARDVLYGGTFRGTVTGLRDCVAAHRAARALRREMLPLTHCPSCGEQIPTGGPGQRYCRIHCPYSAEIVQASR